MVRGAHVTRPYGYVGRNLRDPWISLRNLTMDPYPVLRAGIHGSRNSHKVVACAICGFCVYYKSLHYNYSNLSLAQTYIFMRFLARVVKT